MPICRYIYALCVINIHNELLFVIIWYQKVLKCKSKSLSLQKL